MAIVWGKMAMPITKGSGLFALALVSATPAFSKVPPKIVVGEMAPAFELSLVDGTKVKSTELLGKVVVLNYWATWCGPCKTELPLLNGYYKIQQGNGLRVFAITTEDSLPIPTLRKLFAAMAIPAVRYVKGDYKILGGLPTNYIIDRRGRVRFAKAAAFNLDDLNRELVPLLQESP